MSLLFGFSGPSFCYFQDPLDSTSSTCSPGKAHAITSGTLALPSGRRPHRPRTLLAGCQPAGRDPRYSGNWLTRPQETLASSVVALKWWDPVEAGRWDGGASSCIVNGRRVSGASLERVRKDQATNCYCGALTCFQPSSFLPPALPSLLLCWGYFFPWESTLKVLFKLHLLFIQQVFLEQFLCAQMLQFLVSCTKKFDWRVFCFLN